MNKNRILFSIMGFFVSLILGFGLGQIIPYIGSLITKMADDRESSFISGAGGYLDKNSAMPAPMPMPSAPSDSPSQPTVPSGNPGQVDNNQAESLGSQITVMPEILEVTKPVYKESIKKYSFTVRASSGNLTFILTDANEKELKRQDSGEFIVSPTSSGVYYVCVEDLTGKRSSLQKITGCISVVRKITKEELESIFNSGDASRAQESDFKNRVSSHCKFSFNNCQEEESYQPKSYNEILNRIRMKTWSSVTVNSIYYNDKGQMAGASITVNY